jgi:hypothetical protein
MQQYIQEILYGEEDSYLKLRGFGRAKAEALIWKSTGSHSEKQKGQQKQ